MSDYVLEHKPNLMFIHFLSIDEAGHAYSWGSPQYYNAVKVQFSSTISSSVTYSDPLLVQAVDGYIGEIMTAFETAGIYNDTLFILTADHGG